jgi:DNA-binding response OmpR family regulator
MDDRTQSRKRVLIVDDEPEIGRILATILSAAGFDAAAVNGGRAALARLAEAPADLIILDVVMPAPDGFETLRRLREAPATARLPVIMLTANADDAGRARATELGADDFIAKPFEAADTVARVRALLSRVA